MKPEFESKVEEKVAEIIKSNKEDESKEVME